MKIIHISDNHGSIPPDVEPCDILVHSGDLTNVGELRQVVSVFEWFRRQKAKHIVFIAGNHDRSFDQQFCRDWKNEEVYYRAKQLIDDLPSNIHYLENSGCEIDGIKFWGSPITPDFFPQFWSFNKPRGEVIRQVWNEIADHTNVLITHGPPANILDQTTTFVRTGCSDLLIKVKKINPDLHLFGHIHEAYGIYSGIITTFSNGSILNEKYELKNKPNIFEL